MLPQYLVIYIVFGNDSSHTDLVSNLSFPQLEYHTLRCLVDAAMTLPDTVLCLFQKHDIYLVLSLTLDRTLVGVSPVPVYLVFRLQYCLLSCYLTHGTRSSVGH